MILNIFNPIKSNIVSYCSELNLTDEEIEDNNNFDNQYLFFKDNVISTNWDDEFNIVRFFKKTFKKNRTIFYYVKKYYLIIKKFFYTKKY